MLNTRPIGLVFEQHPRDPANVNAWKNMCDPYIMGTQMNHLGETVAFISQTLV